MKIVTKILLLVTVPICIIMGSVNLLIADRMQQTVHAQIDRELSTNLDFIAREMDLINQDIRRTAEVIGHNRAISRALHLGESRGVNRILNGLVDVYPFLNYVLIVEPNGDIFAASTRNHGGHRLEGEQLLGLNIMENPMILQDNSLAKKIQALSTKNEDVVDGHPGDDPYLELIGIEPAKSQWFVTLVHLQAELLGMVVLAYDWQDEMSRLLKDTTRHLVDTGSPTTELLLVDKDSRILASSNESRSGKFNPDPTRLWKNRPLAIGDTPVDLIIVNDLAHTYKPLVDTRNLLLMFVFIGSTVLIVILYYLLRQILLRRLAILYEGTIQLGKGKFSSRMPELGDDEIGSLAASFNRMAEWLQLTMVSRDYMDSIFESVTEGIITIDDKGLIMTYNNATAKIFGYEHDEIIGQNVSILMPPDEREDHDIYLENSELHESKIIGRNRDLQGRRKSGSLFPMELVVTPLDQKDNRGFVGTIRDISIRKIIDQHLAKQSAELKRTNKELEGFVYVASHDLKAPMRGIDNLTTWIEEDLEGKLDEETLENLVLLRGRVNRMENLLDGLLAYSRVGRAATKAETVDCRELVDDIVDLLALPNGFSVEMPDPMPVLTTERVSLEQVFRNLINNAVKHHDRNQGCITITGTRNNSIYEFTVSDDGAGIAPEFHERVFTMFQTLKPRDEVEGSGMGLALVKKEVELHEGTIRVDSDSDARGTSFCFTWKGNSALLASGSQMSGET